jgi:hypothetical protein
LIHDRWKSLRSTTAMSVVPVTATSAVPESGETALPRRYGPRQIVLTTLLVRTSVTPRLNDCRLLTSTYLESGVTATYLCTSPTLSMARSATDTREMELSEAMPGEPASWPSM